MSLKKIISKIVFLFAFVIFSIGFYYGPEIASGIHKEIISFLVTLSAIIFGVMGAWLSITKIELQQGLEGAKSNDLANSYMKRARGMIEPITIASLVLILSTAFIFIEPILSTADISLTIKWWLKSVSFSLVCVMGYSIIYCLGCIIFQGAEFLLQLSEINQELRSDRDR